MPTLSMNTGATPAIIVSSDTVGSSNFSNIKGDLSGAVASAVLALPWNIFFGMIAFAPLGTDYAGQGFLAGLYASVFARFGRR